MKHFSLPRIICRIGILAFFLPFKSIAVDLMEDDTPPLIKQVEDSISQFEQTDRKRWSYKVVRFENEEGDVTSSTEVYTPNNALSKRWALLELNGKTPSKKQVKRFIKKKVKAAKKKDNEGSNYSFSLRDLINTNSVQLVAEDATHKTLSFDVYIEKLGEDASKKLKGQLTLHKEQQFIDSIEITNIGEFSPMFSASISEFKLTFKFKKVDKAILPIENSMDMKGSFAFFTEINETSVDKYSEFKYVESKE